jgi:lipopolysaccharide export system permease protein
MRILEKYVFKNYIWAFLFCIVLLIVLGIIGDILGFLDDIVKNGIPLKTIFAFYFYLAPFAFVNMVPFACLLSSVYVFNNLSKFHEITAVIASGISLWKLLKPVILVTFILCIFTFIVNDKFVPSTIEKANNIRQEKLELNSTKTSGKKDVALYGQGDLLIYAKSFDPGRNELYGVIIHSEDEGLKVIQKISARVVTWQEEEAFWKGQDVVVFKVDENGDFVGDPVVFKTAKVNIREKPADFIKNQWDPRFMSYMQLKNYLKVFKNASRTTIKRLQVDLHYKLALPFTALITVLVGVPFSISTGRASALVGMAKGISIAILYLPVMAFCLALGKGGILPPFFSAWITNIVFIFIGIYFINSKS